MTPQINRYALVIALLTAGSLSAVGCSRGGGGGGFASTASTAAPTTSASSTSPTTSATTPMGAGPVLMAVTFEDKDGDGKPSKGDRLKLNFDGALIFKAQQVDPAKEFQLAVPGDTFGAGATCVQEGTNNAAIVLGDAPKLRISGSFDPAKLNPGDSSGFDVAASPSGMIVHNTDQAPIRSNGWKDVDGSVTVGFRQGPALVSARGLAEAVALNDGRVFVAGGLRDGKANNYAEDAELFDAVANQWTQVRDISGPDKGRMMDGKIVVRRIKFQATRLQDGKVLITGGYGIHRKGLFGFGKEKHETLDVAHVFDPTTNTFSKTGGMKHDRHSHSATLLSDGRVLLAGGYSDSWWSRSKTEAPFEAFNPKTGKFEQYHHWLIITNKLIEKRQAHVAIGLDGGARVLLAGGEHWEGGWLHWFGKNVLKINKTTEIFSTKDNKSAKVSDLKRGRRRAAAELLSTNEVLVAGGDDDKGIVPTIEVWSPNTSSWTEKGSLKFPRTNARIATFAGETLIIGGVGISGQAKGEPADVEVFDAATSQLKTTTYKLAQGRNSCCVTKLADGRVMVIGGFQASVKDPYGVDGVAINTTEIFAKP